MEETQNQEIKPQTDAPASNTQAPAPKEQPSGRLSARQDVLNAFNEIEQREAPKEPSGGEREKPEGEQTEQPKGAVKDPATGKFVKPEDAAQKPATGDKTESIQPPPNWKGAAKVDWKRLPREVQAAIAEDYKSRTDADSRYAPLAQVLGPRETALTAQYGSVPQALQQLFGLSDYAARDPMGFINWFARSRGINLQQPASQQPNAGQQPEQGIDPALAPLVNRLSGMERFILQQQQAQQQALASEQAEVARQAQAEVSSFIGNAEKYPYANDVRPQMAMLFEAGQAKTMDEAYEQAVLLNPQVRERVLQDRINAEIEKRAETAAQKRGVAVSVSGSPGGAMAAPMNRKATVRDDVMAAAREIGFGGAARI